MKIGFIGAGKMAQAIAQGLISKAGMPPQEIIASARTQATLGKFTEVLDAGILTTTDNLDVVRQSDLIFLAVKPQVAPEVVPSLKSVASGKLVVSIMAGITTTKLSTWLGEEVRLVRAMPNTPSLIGKGITAITAGARANQVDLQQVERLLTPTGKVVVVPESDLDAVTAVSGSGPAYVYHFMEELIRAGVEQGLTPELARQLSIQTVLGAAYMVQETGEDPADLAAKVKSPRGTTVAACEVLELEHWGPILRRAVAAAKKRAAELSQT